MHGKKNEQYKPISTNTHTHNDISSYAFSLSRPYKFFANIQKMCNCDKKIIKLSNLRKLLHNIPPEHYCLEHMRTTVSTFFDKDSYGDAWKLRKCPVHAEVLVSASV